MKYLSRNIKYLRQTNNLTQEEFGKIVGKARSLVSAWESDDREISVEDIIKISTHFNISMENLVGKDLRVINPDEEIKEYNFGDVKVTLSKNRDITDKDMLDIQQFLMKEKILQSENKIQNDDSD